MKTTFMRVALGAALVLAGFVQTGRAQANAGADPTTVPQFKAEFDRAAKRGVPIAPLIGRARHGMTLGQPSSKILDVIRGTADRYVIAREALNPVQGDAELAAGEGALQVNINKAVLRKMRTDYPSRSLAVPLGALQILVTKGVPQKQALTTVEEMLKRQDSDTRIASLGTEIQGLLEQGLAPSRAFEAISRSVLSLPQSPAQGALSTQRR